jgi:threonine dehydratase
LVANDAAESLRSGVIQSLSEQPNTLADGAATLQVGEKTFPHLQALDGFYEVDETHIAYWTQWLQHLLKIHVEPTCAMSMGGVVEWLKSQTSEQKVLVMLSGGNIDQQKMLKIWQNDHLQQIPNLFI